MSSITINNTTLNFNNIYYVDSINGNDTTGNGSLSNPYKTVYKAVNSCASTGDCVFCKEGNYDITYVSSSYGAGGIFDYGKAISFIGTQGKTIFTCDGVKNTGRDHHAICLQNVNSTIYQIIFDVKLNGRTSAYQTAIVGYDSVSANGKIYNCVFKYDYPPAMIYDNSSSANVFFYNCIFKTNGGMQSSYSGASRPKLTNCACNYSLPSDISQYTCLSNVTYDDKYRITSAGWKNLGTGINTDGSKANIGLEGCDYAWRFYILKHLLSDNNEIKYIDSSLNIQSLGYITPSANNYINYGMDDLTKLNTNKLNLLSNKVKVLSFCDDTTENFRTKINAIPKPQLVLMKSDIDLSNIDKINSMTITSNINGSGIARIIVSFDKGNTWKSYNTTISNWDTIDILDMNSVKLNGMTKEIFNSISSINWETLRNNSKSMRLGYYMEISSTGDTSNIDSLSLNCNMQGEWMGAINGTDYRYSYKSNTKLAIMIYSSGTYKINYPQ